MLLPFLEPSVLNAQTAQLVLPGELRGYQIEAVNALLARDAFLLAVRDARSFATIKALMAAIESGDVRRIVADLDVGRSERFALESERYHAVLASLLISYLAHPAWFDLEIDVSQNPITNCFGIDHSPNVDDTLFGQHFNTIVDST